MNAETEDEDSKEILIEKKGIQQWTSAYNLHSQL